MLKFAFLGVYTYTPYQRTGEGNDLYHEMIETGVINRKFDTSLATH